MRQKDPEALTAAVRIALGRMITQEIAGEGEELPVMTLAPQLERMLQEIQSRLDSLREARQQMEEELAKIKSEHEDAVKLRERLEQERKRLATGVR